MADFSSVIPAGVLLDLGDQNFEKHRNAAREIVGIVKQFALSGEHEKISAVINILASKFALSPQANLRKGGLRGLTATIVGLEKDDPRYLRVRYLRQIILPVLECAIDQENISGQYYACESLFTISKVLKEEFFLFFKGIFDKVRMIPLSSDLMVQNTIHFLNRLIEDIVIGSNEPSIKELIPPLLKHMNVLHPPHVKVLIGLITMCGDVSDALGGLFDMLSDPSHEFQRHIDSKLSEILQNIKNTLGADYGCMTQVLIQKTHSTDELTRVRAITWINEFVKLGVEKLEPYYAEILGAISPCMSDEKEEIRVAACEINEAIRSIHANPADGCKKDDD